MSAVQVCQCLVPESRQPACTDLLALSRGRPRSPKTIDNDLCVTDHCPGFASAARFVAHAFQGARSHRLPRCNSSLFASTLSAFKISQSGNT